MMVILLITNHTFAVPLLECNECVNKQEQYAILNIDKNDCHISNIELYQSFKIIELIEPIPVIFL